ncbi:MAG: TRAP transporter TatT component family protein, partial [bacterium]
MRRALLHIAILPALAALLAGCSLKQLAIRSTAAILDDSLAALSAEPDPAQAREAAASLLVMLEGLMRGDPENAGLRRTAAQAYGSFAFGFLEAEEPDRARRLYRRGRDHGLRALKTAPGFAAGGDLAAFKKAIAGLGRESLPLLFWTAYCWSGWINLSRSDPDAVADLARV